MQVAGLVMNDAWAHRVLRANGVRCTHAPSRPAMLGVLVEQVDLGHHPGELNFRPYLHVSGQLRSVTPAHGLACDVSRVTFAPGRGEQIDAFYEFDDQQLQELAGLGYFQVGFTVPDQITGIEWELPATVDALILEPETPGEDVPVTFVSVHDAGHVRIDLLSTGYDLTEYFARPELAAGPDVPDAGEQPATPDVPEVLAPAADLLDEPGVPAAGGPQSDRVLVEAGLAEQLRRADERVRADQEARERELAAQPGTVEHLYRQHVAMALAPTRAADHGSVDDVELDDPHPVELIDADVDDFPAGQAGDAGVGEVGGLQY